jgi:hypothetical protein
VAAERPSPALIIVGNPHWLLFLNSVFVRSGGQERPLSWGRRARVAARAQGRRPVSRPRSAPVSHTADGDHAMLRGTSVGDTACGICRADEVNLVPQTEEEATAGSQGSSDQSDGENAR